MNSTLKYFFHLINDSPRKWHPLLSVYYLTYDCNFRCSYCSDGFGNPYYKLNSPNVPFEIASEIIKNMRRYCENIVITGGEPLLYPELDKILKYLRCLKFKCVVLTTNGYQLEPFLPAIGDAVHDLVFSLDTLDAAKADQIFGAGTGRLTPILENIETASQFKKKKYKITISSVVTPDNIKDLYGVYDYTMKNGFTFAACPQLVGVKAHESLVSNPDYKAFFNYLILEKKKGRSIFGTVLYLKYMRDLNEFKCRPFTMLVVSPEGHVYYPCLERGKSAGNILDADSLNAIRKNGYRLYGPQPECGNQCHSACALSFSLILKYPLSAFDEMYRMAKGLLF